MNRGPVEEEERWLRLPMEDYSSCGHRPAGVKEDPEPRVAYLPSLLLLHGAAGIDAC